MASTNFTEVTDSAGLDYSGQSFGGSWGDFNDDGFIDLWVTNHALKSTLFVNDGNGQFTDVSDQTVEGGGGDTHGTAWADFDNDGDRDLIEVVGGGSGSGTGPNNFYINENGTLENSATEVRISYPNGRSRTPIWLDYDNDGRLDLVVAAIARSDGQAPSNIFRQNSNGTFEGVRDTTGFSVEGSTTGTLADVSGDGTLELIMGGGLKTTVYDTSSGQFVDVTDEIPFGEAKPSDIVAADFNGDLKSDILLVDGVGGSDINRANTNTVEGLIDLEGKEEGFQFNSSGDVTIDLSALEIPPEDIFIGSSGFNPTDNTFTLSSENTNVEGIFNHSAGEDRGIYISYDSTTQTWQILASSPNFLRVSSVVTSTEPITELTSIGFDDSAAPDPNQLLFSSDEGFEDRSDSSGINDISRDAGSVVTGDFDNDRDVDIYIVATKSSRNQPNILYDNQGDGTFVAVESAGGALGSEAGIGDSAITADYNNDGFLDLFVMNGEGVKPFSDGPSQLFRNEGNDNHWLQIDLEGTTSNQDGIGAKVFVTSDGVTQVREQSGGVHRHSQNQQRIHFGLGDSTEVDEIVIQWPSGIEQKIENVSTDQIIEVVESSQDSATTDSTVESLVDSSATVEEFTAEDYQGQPNIDVRRDTGLYLWQDENDIWNLQAVAGGTEDSFSGTISGDTELELFESDSLEPNDDSVGTSNPNQIDFEFNVYGLGEDAIQFKFADSTNVFLELEEGKNSFKIGSDALAVENGAVELLS